MNRVESLAIQKAKDGHPNQDSAIASRDVQFSSLLRQFEDKVFSNLVVRKIHNPFYFSLQEKNTKNFFPVDTKQA
ncbi:MAG: hypothetical protein AAB279_05915 [Candidatus Binatota bacterium]